MQILASMKANMINTIQYYTLTMYQLLVMHLQNMKVSIQYIVNPIRLQKISCVLLTCTNHNILTINYEIIYPFFNKFHQLTNSFFFQQNPHKLWFLQFYFLQFFVFLLQTKRIHRDIAFLSIIVRDVPIPILPISATDITDKVLAAADTDTNIITDTFRYFLRNYRYIGFTISDIYRCRYLGRKFLLIRYQYRQNTPNNSKIYSRTLLHYSVIIIREHPSYISTYISYCAHSRPCISQKQQNVPNIGVVMGGVGGAQAPPKIQNACSTRIFVCIFRIFDF
eukprot:TRINITY_DN12716_c1_g1_i1.p3 TRINITY_DN12716_c1_g1~~TRINITY_DN12716_c1_g1_i1.p3  ORF type:complete len:280 (+),score=-27.77 TRINITY_DN12716_c1_g1_i1:268-1107(+)